MFLNASAEKLIRLFTDSGYKAYAVGGCVRDALMNREAGDIDITTSATPDEVEALLKANNINFVETGLKHGTITAIIEQIPFEITTFRSDGAYKDNRHPESVSFVTELREDVARRDFTMNSIAFNPREGYIDYFDGSNDIKRKIIRCVGEPDVRFNEDALRIMRAIRFSAVLGFDIESETKASIFKNKELLKTIAVERLFTELKKLLLGEYVEQVLVEYKEVISVIIPELVPCFGFHQNTKWHLFDVYTHIVKTVSLAPNKDYMKLSALLHDIGKPQTCVSDSNGIDHFKGHPLEGVEMAKIILRRFKVSNELLNKVILLIQYHDDHITVNPSNIKRWLRLLGEELTFDLIDLKIADMGAHNLKYTQSDIDSLMHIKKLAEGILERKEPYKISHLKINGSDLLSLGYSGRDIADELTNLIRMVSSNPELNTKPLLVEQAVKDLHY